MRFIGLLGWGFMMTFPFVLSGQPNRPRTTPSRVLPPQVLFAGQAWRQQAWHLQSTRSLVVVVPAYKAKAGVMPTVVVNNTTSTVFKSSPAALVPRAQPEVGSTRVAPASRAINARAAMPERLAPPHVRHQPWKGAFVSMVPYHNHSTHWGRSWFSNVTLTPAFFRQPIQTQLKQLDRLSAGDASLRHWERNLIAKEKAGMKVSWASFTERWSRIPAYRHHLSPQEELERPCPPDPAHGVGAAGDFGVGYCSRQKFMGSEIGATSFLAYPGHD